MLSSDEVRTGFVSGLTFGPRAVQYAVVDGRAIFKGDIDLGSVEEVEKSNAVMRGAALEEAVILPGASSAGRTARSPSTSTRPCPTSSGSPTRSRNGSPTR